MAALSPSLTLALLLVVLCSFADGMARRPRCTTQKKGECVERKNCRSTAVIADEHPILTLCPKQRKGSDDGDLVCCPANGIRGETSSSGSGSSSSSSSSPSSSGGKVGGKFGSGKAGTRSSSSASSEECKPQPDKEKTLCQTKHRGICIPDEHCEHLVSGNVNHEDACPDSEDLVCCNPRNSTSTCVSQSGVCMSWCATELRRSGTGCSSSCPMCCIPIG